MLAVSQAFGVIVALGFTSTYGIAAAVAFYILVLVMIIGLVVWKISQASLS